MRTRIDMPDHLLALGAEQAGVLHRAQLTGLPTGTIRRLRDGWVVLGNGLFCLQEPTWSSAAWAGLLRGGETSVLGGAAASFLHGFLLSAPRSITVWLPTTSKPQFTVGDWTVVFRRGERRGIGRPTHTNVEDTILDSAGEVGEDSIVAVIARALTNRRTIPGRLLEALSFRKRLRHRSVIENMCGAAGQGIESVLEWRYKERVEQRHKLPALERQALLGGHARLDGIYREFNLAVELDGRQFHDASKDMLRDNRHLLLHSVDTLRYGWHAVTTQPCLVAAQVVQALNARGWNGRSRRCRDCPPV